ncbi:MULTISPECIES: cytochrome P460 family protein [unclassified Meridianimarinicoccus]|uniref:cytochrome P460 family protein n=1 Tax=unclassified Meridianimarinicoccus TaxID=2923344 RepID=UPI001865E5B2|nr:cytochrome P460 family protein [Fluviibacterium sp. MJW13]
MATIKVMTVAGLAVLGLSGGVRAQDCDPGKSGYDLTGEEAAEVYDCIAEGLKAGYDSGPKRWIPAEFVADYRGWTAASAFPAAPGMHSERFLLTFVNDTGAEAYMQYAEDPVIPAGTVIAKESFSVSEAGKVTPGPLFLMQKVAAGTSPETLDWYYMAVAPSGAPMGLDVMTACNECHLGYDFQGGLGYPVEDARISN